jgi:hypothetical protein
MESVSDSEGGNHEGAAAVVPMVAANAAKQSQILDGAEKWHLPNQSHH